jgi:hypothetical protein
VRAGRVSASVCNAPLAERELAIRIVQSGVTTKDARVLPLGDALVDSHAGRVLGTICADRVRWLASAAANASTLWPRDCEAGPSAGSLEAAHDIAPSGHVTKTSVAAGNWAFTKPDVAAMHRRASVRGRSCCVSTARRVRQNIPGLRVLGSRPGSVGDVHNRNVQPTGWRLIAPRCRRLLPRASSRGDAWRCRVGG